MKSVDILFSINILSMCSYSKCLRSFSLKGKRVKLTSGRDH